MITLLLTLKLPFFKQILDESNMVFHPLLVISSILLCILDNNDKDPSSGPGQVVIEGSDLRDAHELTAERHYSLGGNVYSRATTRVGCSLSHRRGGACFERSCFKRLRRA